MHDDRLFAAPPGSFFDALECVDPAEREQALMAALPLQIAHAQAEAPAFAALFAGMNASSDNSRTGLA